MHNEQFLAWERSQGYRRSPIVDPVQAVRQYEVPEISFADRIAKQYRLNYHGLTVQERLQLSLLQDVPMPLFKHMLMALPLNEYVILWGNCKEDVPHVEPIAVTFFVSAQEPAFTHQTSSIIWYDLQADKLFLKREDDTAWSEVTRYYTVWNHTTV